MTSAVRPWPGPHHAACHSSAGADVTADAILHDGTAVRIRPISPNDEARLVAFHERLSPESRRLRFFSAHPHLQTAEARRFVNVDGTRRVALVATQDDDIVGVARFDRVAETTDAEAALVVQDNLQGHGLGTALLERLAVSAREKGITRLVALILPENTRMRQVLRHLRSDMTAGYAGGVVEVTVPLIHTERAAKTPDGANEHDRRAGTVGSPDDKQVREVGE